jgi:hypothetical protein
MHLQKQGVLRVYEIYEFIKIINYFLYLKRFNFEGKLFEWMDKIIIPNDIDPQYSRNDNYTAEVRMCQLNKKQIKLDLIETITINNKDFNSTEQRHMYVFPCGEEKKINFRNESLSICKGDDGLVHFTIESPLTK